MTDASRVELATYGWGAWAELADATLPLRLRDAETGTSGKSDMIQDEEYEKNKLQCTVSDERQRRFEQ